LFTADYVAALRVTQPGHEQSDLGTASDPNRIIVGEQSRYGGDTTTVQLRIYIWSDVRHQFTPSPTFRSTLTNSSTALSTAF
jgi:hypothetical protein